jgi:hypothetical protein
MNKNFDYNIKSQEFASTENLLNVQKKENKFIYFLIFIILIYVILIYIDVHQNFGEMIQAINKIKTGTHRTQFDGSAFVIGLCIRLPAFAKIIYYNTPNFPYAVFYAYYSKKIRSIMGDGVTYGTHPVDYLNTLYQQALQDPNQTSADIICTVFPKDKKDCYPLCPSNVNFSPTRTYASNIAAGVGTLGTAGAMFGGPVGAVLGGLGGTILGIFKSHSEIEEHEKKCKQLKEHCWVPPNKSFKC